jgi:hypothetical protein
MQKTSPSKGSSRNQASNRLATIRYGCARKH